MLMPDCHLRVQQLLKELERLVGCWQHCRTASERLQKLCWQHRSGVPRHCTMYMGHSRYWQGLASSSVFQYG